MRGVEISSETADERVETTIEDYRVVDLFLQTLSYARDRDYTGWDYGDGMSSRILQALPVDNKWLNLVFQETSKRCPVNVRPLLLVEQRRNFKGTALFSMANLTASELGFTQARHAPNQSPVDYAAEADELAAWLVEHQCSGYGGFCGGHRHPIQHLDGRGQPSDPDVVSTSYATKALLRAGALDEAYPDIARSATEFVDGHLNYRQVEGDRGAKVNYHLNHSEEYYTINAGALCARLFVDLYAQFGDDAYRTRARELLDHIADLQADIGGWTYRHPPDASHLSMDNHHNGFVIESFQRYHAVTDEERYADTLDTALHFYRHELFEPNGAPNFDEQNAYPRDIHASTQGVLVFTYAGDLQFARQILQWVFDNLHAGDGQFYYRKERFYTRRVTLMRWCQAWMAYAMGEYLKALKQQ
ncbi:antibiotic ABC transporter permease [Halorientalis brevis]|uniref:Antibiotic ABC transporter permease n=1 Tax=Halorientalis brevis TaxID=1126241 RepID=A0ABD6CG57_9EURY|nr:antibiotic ABC transporter permease [Halorientalis brevis]